MPDVLQPVAETLAHPPLLLVRPALQPGIFADSGNLPNFASPNNAISYGAIFSVQQVPDNLARTSEARPQYSLPLIRLTFLERLGNAQLVNTTRVEIHELDQVVRWFSFPIGAMSYECLPGVTFAFSYLYLL